MNFLFSGPFASTLDRTNFVDMSRPLSSGFWAVVIPIETRSNMWFYTDPFSDNVWLTIVISIPIYIIVMGLVYHFYSGIGDWSTVS